MALAARFLGCVTLLYLAATEVAGEADILGCEFDDRCMQGGLSCFDGRSCHSVLEQSIDGLLHPDSASTDPASLLPPGKTVCSVSLKVVGTIPGCEGCRECTTGEVARVLTDSWPEEEAGPSRALSAVAFTACVSVLVAGFAVAARQLGADAAPARSLDYTEPQQDGAPIADGREA
jgi:hypothetical protein